MRRLVVLVFLLLSPLYAQSTQQDLEARLIHKPLYLRGLWRDDKLKFDKAGSLIGTSMLTPFTVSGVEILKVSVKTDRLVLDGRRIGLVFDKSQPRRVVLQVGHPPRKTHDETMQIEVDAPETGDYSPALDAIFASELTDLFPTLPVYWQKWAAAFPGDAGRNQTPPHDSPARRIGGGVQPPKVLNAPEPTFTDYARALKQRGKVLVYLQVAPDGSVDHVAVLRPAGLGLDEQAISAVQKYRFNPATENGGPVRVELNVEVNFQVF